MSKRVVYLLCGVPGSGKTWVLDQLRDHFAIVENDRFIGMSSAFRIEALHEAAAITDAPLITDCPFAERELRVAIERSGFQVQPVFIIETPFVVGQRYGQRTGKMLSTNNYTRASTIINRADEWQAPRGTAAHVLAMLRMIGEGGQFGEIKIGDQEPIRTAVQLNVDPTPNGPPAFTVFEAPIEMQVTVVRPDEDDLL